MQSRDRTALGQFAREHHVHYEVEPEEVVEGGHRARVGADVRLFATHEKAKLVVPGCPECVALLRDLTSFADQVVRTTELADRSEIVPTPQALYKSTEVPGADEVAVTVRLRCAVPEHRRPGGGEDPCLGGIRDRLAEVGIPRR